jgi:hypothetical protein
MLLLPVLFAATGLAADMDVTIEVAGQGPTTFLLRDVTNAPIPSVVVTADNAPSHVVDFDARKVGPDQFLVAATLHRISVDADGRWALEQLSRPRLTVIAGKPGIVEQGRTGADGEAAHEFRMEFVVRP